MNVSRCYSKETYELYDAKGKNFRLLNSGAAGSKAFWNPWKNYHLNMLTYAYRLNATILVTSLINTIAESDIWSMMTRVLF